MRDCASGKTKSSLGPKIGPNRKPNGYLPSEDNLFCCLFLLENGRITLDHERQNIFIIINFYSCYVICQIFSGISLNSFFLSRISDYPFGQIYRRSNRGDLLFAYVTRPQGYKFYCKNVIKQKNSLDRPC